MADPTRADQEPAPTPAFTLGSDDLPAQAADWVVDRVDKVKQATTDNAVVAVRGIVYGLVVAVMGITALVLLTIIFVRIADAYLPIGSGVGDATWAAHLFIGALLAILGLGAWASRKGEGAPGGLYLAAALDAIIVSVVTTIGIIDAVG